MSHDHKNAGGDHVELKVIHLWKLLSTFKNSRGIVLVC